MSLNVRREREKANEWWNKLQPSERWLLGDGLVLGSYDWREWGFDKAPTATFLNEVDRLRMLWEDSV